MNFTNIREELSETLQNGIIPFWLDRSVDKEYGGYITSFDENGKFDGNGIKNIVTQARMVWGFSRLMPYAKEADKKRMKEAAEIGKRFLIDKFWDHEYGGYYWLLNRDGSVYDDSKLTYGEGFAIYALSQYYITYGDKEALEYAEKGFDALLKYSSDTLRGGYYENVERDWRRSPDGKACGDRKSLDIHMHLLEAFTTLAAASGKEVHRSRLEEVYNLICRHMVNFESGYGYNQFDLEFNKIPAVNIPRTWNAERESNEKISTPENTTSYGHNVELSWLADEALDVIGHRTDKDNELLVRLLDHALEHGYDWEHGGVFRDGIGNGPALVHDKEWWQNFESMTGFLNGFVMTGNEKYYDAFVRTWDFDNRFFMNHELGESRQLLAADGTPLVPAIGNPWKGIYHTGRAFAECIDRLDKCIQKEG